MNRHLGLAAFLLGLAAVAWVGVGYAATQPLALAMTLLIAAVYLMGALELRRFQQATTELALALERVPEALPRLGDWLATLPASLQNPVRLRVEGERVGLPGPAMTPYLVGLLVLLGMLGTFLGMVVTLKGAVLALESTTDLAAIRAALTAPVKGLGLAFGTSVAGVAASAMLGLMSALCRRERLQAAQRLDSGIATRLSAFSLAHQRQEGFRLMQTQARLMPELVEHLQALMAQLAQQGQAQMAQVNQQGEALHQRLIAGQDDFHQRTHAAYTELARSVDRTLQTSLAEGARLASTTLQPMVEATLAGIGRETRALQQQTTQAVQQQLEGLSSRFDHSVHQVADTWREALAQHQHSSSALSAELKQALDSLTRGFGQQASGLLASVDRSHQALQASLAAGDSQRLAAWGESMSALAATLHQQLQQAGHQALGQQQAICSTLEATAREINTQAEAHARSTITEIAGLMQTAAEAPRAAAEVMGLLREKLADSLSRDNTLLEERSRIMGTLGSLLDAINHAATEQRSAIDGLVASSTALLDQAGTRFTQQLEAEAQRIGSVAHQITGSAVEVASLGETFGFAVQQFSASNEALIVSLQRIEAALSKSSHRSDEQLAYYVAQARELIDLSILSQKQVVDDLRQLANRPQPLAAEVA